MLSIPRVARRVERGVRAVGRELIEGIRYIAGNSVILSLACLNFGTNLGMGAVVALLVFHAKENLDLDAAQTGLIFMIATAGALAGTALAAPLSRRFSKGPVIVVASALLGLANLQLVWAWSLAGIAAVWSVAMACAAIVTVLYRTLQQEIVPNELLGRVSGATMMLGRVAVPLSMGAAGAVAELAGVRVVFGAAAAVMLAAAALASFTPLRNAA